MLLNFSIFLPEWYFCSKTGKGTTTPTLLWWNSSKNTSPLIDISWHPFSSPTPLAPRLEQWPGCWRKPKVARVIFATSTEWAWNRWRGEGKVVKTKMKQRGPDGWYLGYWDSRHSWLMGQARLFFFFFNTMNEWSQQPPVFCAIPGGKAERQI